MATMIETEPLSRPTRSDYARAWRELARAIAARRGEIREDPQAPPAVRGELMVIGSGIETAGFALGDEELLRSADKVFFCVADPATVVWIRERRPDAYDLYVLYDDAKPRYVTYMQMAEAMLHYVRDGLRVVCVFYGHPGIFVLATHRAILIARREGHRATMRPAVCALDCLCADLGVDPCHPGMQTHEATDMLVRQRQPDTSLHVVLWQVGLIGEMGFRREGYINRNFSLFINYLQRAYGETYPVTHYVASRYPTILPLIETYRLSELHDPVIQSRITGLSTFYLAPRDATAADRETVERLGLLRPGQTLKTAVSPLREIGSYGSREMKAFDDFARFNVPKDYQWQPDTEASRFLIALREDVALQRLYETDPRVALSDPRFAALSRSERQLLVTRDAGAIQIAAKGLHRREASNHALILALLSDRKACVRLLRHRRANAGTGTEAWLAAYAAERCMTFVDETFATDVAHTRRHFVLPWTGVYAAEPQRLTITLLGSRHGGGGLLYVNDTRVRTFTFRHGAIEWRAANGNTSNGFLRFAAGKAGRRIVGRIWTGDQPRPELDYFEAGEVNPDREHLAPALGRFLRGDALPPDGDYTLHLRTARGSRRVALRLDADGAAIGGAAACIEQADRGKLVWSGGADTAPSGALDVLCNPLTGDPELYGHVTLHGGEQLTCSGARIITSSEPLIAATTLPAWVADHLIALCRKRIDDRPRFLWPAWEKHHLTSRVVNMLAD
jgi:hypothetical protein